jgi:hypothetical protein
MPRNKLEINIQPLLQKNALAIPPFGASNRQCATVDDFTGVRKRVGLETDNTFGA